MRTFKVTARGTLFKEGEPGVGPTRDDFRMIVRAMMDACLDMDLIMPSVTGSAGDSFMAVRVFVHADRAEDASVIGGTRIRAAADAAGLITHGIDSEWLKGVTVDLATDIEGVDREPEPAVA